MSCPREAFQTERRQTTCVWCREGLYLKDEMVGLCLECPRGAVCAGASIIPGENNFLHRTQSGELRSFTCLPGHCGDGSSCSSDPTISPSSVNTTINAQSGSLACCAANRKPAAINPLCGECEENYVDWSVHY